MTSLAPNLDVASTHDAVADDEFTARRASLLDVLGPNAIAVLGCDEGERATPWVRYLTGCDEPGTVVVLSRQATCGGAQASFAVFAGGRVDPLAAPRRSLDALRSALGAAAAYPRDRLAEALPELLLGHHTVVCELGRPLALDAVVPAMRRAADLSLRARRLAPTRLEATDARLDALRARKSSAEVERIRRSCELSIAAHRAAVARVADGVREHAVEAAAVEVFRAHGASAAYPPSVASGERACFPHYRANTGVLRDGAMVLLDLGCELDGYASDLARTVPVDGRFSPAQRALYDAVLAAHSRCLAAVRPGLDLGTLQMLAVQTLAEGLARLGLLPPEPKAAMARVLSWFPHAVGHWIGLEVHDAGGYLVEDPRGDTGASLRTLTAGHVLTLEPGLYLPPDADVPAQYRGVGVRIEDVVLVVADGAEVLSEGLPRDAVEVERWCAEARRRR